jgi:signal transduction histidine kinase
MMASLFNWRNLLALLAILIVTGTVFYSRYLAKKIAAEERLKVQQWVAASKSIIENPANDITLANLIRNEQTSVPIIETNEQDSIISYINLDTAKATTNSNYLLQKLKEFKRNNEPLLLVLSDTPFIANKYYYGNTPLLAQVQYYPLIQLLIVALFIIVTIIAITTQNKSTQNQLWAGMAKETAHQLGTPLSSLQGWVEMLKENKNNDAITYELEKDVERLKLVSDRFSKIGSTPKLEEHNIITQVNDMVNYMRKRAAGKVQFTINLHGMQSLAANISAPLFDWVIENLLKNALDAMDGKGNINIEIKQQEHDIIIDIKDSGKGITTANIAKVFKPGFTTKKRGWGLGLTLSKRIIEQYHNGKIFVKESSPANGTTFRIILPALQGV